MISIIKKEITEFLRNGSNLFFTIFFPSILVFLLGTLLQNLDVSDYDIGEINLGYYSVSEFKEAKSFYETLEKNGVINLVEVKDLDNAKEKINNEELTAVLETNDNKLIMYVGANSPKNRALKSMTEGFLYMNNTYKASAVNMENPMELINIQPSKESYTQQKDLGVQRSMIDYYAITMIVMTIFMGCFAAGSETFAGEKITNTMNRISISPQKPIAVFFAKTIGTFPVVVIPIITIMIISSLFFSANYCSKFSDNLILVLLLFAASLATTSIGILIGLIMRKGAAAGVIQGLSWTLCFFSGTFSKEIYIEGFTNRCPPYIIQQAAFDLTLFGRSEQAFKVIAVSLIVFVVFMIIGGIIFGKRRRYNG